MSQIQIQRVNWNPEVTASLHKTAYEPSDVPYIYNLWLENKVTILRVVDRGYFIVGLDGNELVFYHGEGHDMGDAFEAMLEVFDPEVARVHTRQKGMGKLLKPYGFILEESTDFEDVYKRYKNYGRS